MIYLLDFRCPSPELSGLWGPFNTRSAASAFALVLAAEEGGGSGTWNTVPLKNPDTYPFSEGS